LLLLFVDLLGLWYLTSSPTRCFGSPFTINVIFRPNVWEMQKYQQTHRWNQKEIRLWFESLC
jgi:hypothetical protein